MFNPLVDKGMKAVGNFLSKSKDMVDGGMEVSTTCKLFTSTISPCLLYGSQIWGISPEVKSIERVLVTLCRRIIQDKLHALLFASLHSEYREGFMNVLMKCDDPEVQRALGAFVYHNYS